MQKGQAPSSCSSPPRKKQHREQEQRNGGLGNSWCTTPWPVAQGARPAFRRAACQKRAPVPQRFTRGWARPVKKPPLPPCLWKRFLVSDGQTSNLVIRSAHVLEQTSCKALHGMCSQQSVFRSYAQLRGCEAMCRMTAVHADDRLNDHPKHTRHRACSAAALKELCFFDAKYPACSAKRPRAGKKRRSPRPQRLRTQRSKNRPTATTTH